MKIQRVTTSYRDDRGEITDILSKHTIEYATLITTRKGAVRANHYHKETWQHMYVLQGKLAVVVQMPGEEAETAVIETGDLIENAPNERHAFEALEDSTVLVFTRGPRGGQDYEEDTYRLDVPLIPQKQR